MSPQACHRTAGVVRRLCLRLPLSMAPRAPARCAPLDLPPIRRVRVQAAVTLRARTKPAPFCFHKIAVADLQLVAASTVLFQFAMYKSAVEEPDRTAATICAAADASSANRHLMAGVIKLKMMSCEGQRRSQSGRRSAEIARDSLSLAPNRYKCHNYQRIGYLGDSAEGFLHPLKSKLGISRVGLHVAVKVHKKADDGSCSSEVADEHNGTLSNASRKLEVNHLGALRCYFSKLNSEKVQKPYSFRQNNTQNTGPLSINIEEAKLANDYGDFKNTLESLEVRFNRRNRGTKGYLKTAVEDYTDYLIFDEKNFLDTQKDDQASSFCLTNLLAAINIAVSLFEIASPVRNTDIENLSLPLMYGAKINDLILSGEWWRLLTPMCLDEMARWDKRRERELGGQETQRWPGTSIVLQLGDGKGWCIGGEDPAVQI
uniref:Uncharacterized protein n=1 Tax=Leersia perrieri TaxID=77586 RepID=A0A0D9VFD9_9ORYZ